MAAIFYQPQEQHALFAKGFQVNDAIQLPFLDPLIGPQGFSIVTEVTIQNRDTIQYFLTFDDFISYFYFGKGLGSISISGVMYSNCIDGSPNWLGPGLLMSVIQDNRGKKVPITFGAFSFTGVISSFTIRACSDEGLSNAMDFNIQMDIIAHSLTPPTIEALCD